MTSDPQTKNDVEVRHMSTSKISTFFVADLKAYFGFREDARTLAASSWNTPTMTSYGYPGLKTFKTPYPTKIFAALSLAYVPSLAQQLRPLLGYARLAPRRLLE